MKTFEEFLMEKRITNTKLDSIQIGSEYEGGLYVGVVDGKELVVNSTLIPKNKYSSLKGIIKGIDGGMGWRLPTFEEYKIIFANIDLFTKSAWYWTSETINNEAILIYPFNSLRGTEKIKGIAVYNALLVRNP